MTPFPTLSVDPKRPGIVRFSDDPTEGFLIGVKASEIVRRCNAHDGLVRALKEARAKLVVYFNETSTEGTRDYSGGVPYQVLLKRIDAALKTGAP